ncbi:hypothetical protein [Kitasatospora sp. HPMI-4]|uniref:hypothetical protein n=1 Tax=Kitasatospora sp. HPMI-4 TaxID=3448443 RepID=UPI003F1B1E4B
MKAVLEKPAVPSWTVLESLITALRGRAEDIRSLWERLQLANDPRWTPESPTQAPTTIPTFG